MTKIMVQTNGQAIITLPARIFDVMGWKKGDEINFEVLGRDKLKLERVKKTPPENRGEYYNDES